VYAAFPNHSFDAASEICLHNSWPANTKLSLRAEAHSALSLFVAAEAATS
jgi:hypothetical protein